MSELCKHVAFTLTSNHLGSVGSVVVIVFNAVSMLVAIPGNILTATAITRQNNLRKEPTYILMFSVCLADAMVSTVTQSLYISALTLHDPPCEFYYTIFVIGWTSTLASVLGVDAIAFDRFLYIMYPLRYRSYMNRRRAVLLVIVVWVSAILFGTVSLVWHSSITLHSASLAHTILSCLFITIIYAVVYRKAIVSKLQRKQSRKDKRQSQATRTVVTIILVFLGCWTPWVVISFIMAVHEETVGLERYQPESYMSILQALSLTLGFFNSSFNVFIYTFKNAVLRKALLRFVCSKSMRTRAASISLISRKTSKGKGTGVKHSPEIVTSMSRTIGNEDGGEHL